MSWLDRFSKMFGMGSFILVAFLLIMGLGGHMIVNSSEQLLKFVYIVPIVFLFLAITAFLLILLHYAVTLQKTIPGTPVSALGLPEGSVRAFLAIGLLALVAVFGAFLYFESKGGSYPEAGLLQTDDLSATRQALGDKFILILDPRESDKASEAFLKTPAAKTEIERAKKAMVAYQAELAKPRQPQAPIPPEPSDTQAKLEQKVYRVVSTTLDTSRSDLAKQLLIMITTLLTTVVGFYFGSRTGEGGSSGDLDRRAGALNDITAIHLRVGNGAKDLDVKAEAVQGKINSKAEPDRKNPQAKLDELKKQLEVAGKDLEEASAVASAPPADTTAIIQTKARAVEAERTLAEIGKGLAELNEALDKPPPAH